MPKLAVKTEPAIPQWARYCRESLGEFYLALNPTYKYVPYQQEIIVPALEGLERGDYDRLMLFMPSRHAKSDVATKAFIPYFLARNPRKNVMLLCHTQPLANTFGSHVRNVMARDDKFKRIFPEVRIDNSNHAKDFFRTNRGNDFYAFGINAGVPGRGADLIDIDDPIRSMEDGLSEIVQDQLYETYKAVVKQRLQAGGKILICMTRWAIRDLAARILEDEGKNWKVLSIPAQPPDPNCKGCQDGAEHDCKGPFLWEEHYGRERYLEAKQDLFIWNSMWQQAPAPRLMQGFKESWLRFYVHKTDAAGRPNKTEYREDGSVLSEPVDWEHLMKRCNIYMFVDPAMGKDAAHDRTCMLLLAAGPERRFFLVDAVLDRLDPGERINKVIELCRKWRVHTVLYEEYALTADTYFLRLRLDDEDMSDKVNIISVGRKAIKGMNGGRLSKHDRILQLIPDFQEGRIWLPKRMSRICQDGTQIDIIQHFLSKEYLGYAGEGSIAHDDMLDCLSRLRDADFCPEFITRGNIDDDEVDYGYAGGGGSWETL